MQSTIRICFHERRLQYMEKEQMSSWQRARPGDRILEVDIPLSYGLFEVSQPTNALNVVQFNWDPTKEVGVYIKVISHFTIKNNPWQSNWIYKENESSVNILNINILKFTIVFKCLFVFASFFSIKSKDVLFIQICGLAKRSNVCCSC